MREVISKEFYRCNSIQVISSSYNLYNYIWRLGRYPTLAIFD